MGRHKCYAGRRQDGQRLWDDAGTKYFQAGDWEMNTEPVPIPFGLKRTMKEQKSCLKSNNKIKEMSIMDWHKKMPRKRLTLPLLIGVIVAGVLAFGGLSVLAAGSLGPGGSKIPTKPGTVITTPDL
jgi:hypothetical protein